MPSFADLPQEFIPLVAEQITKPAHLARIVRVSRAFRDFTAPLLYERIYIYPWLREGKTRARSFRGL
jgi:hypothetical protein